MSSTPSPRAAGAATSSEPSQSSAAGPTEGSSRGAPLATLTALLARWAVVGGLVLMVVYFSLAASSTFLTSDTLKSILDQSVVPWILVSGLTFVLAVGEFDLSFTGTLGMCAGIGVVLMANDGVPVILAILLALLAGLGAGVIVGVLVAFGRASSFIITLAVGSALTGLELAITNNTTIYQNIPSSFGSLTSDTILGIHDPVWLSVVVLLAAGVLLHGTRFGRHVKAVGGNQTAAFLAGVPVARIKFVAFGLVGLLAALSAVILTSRAASYYPDASGSFLLNSYAAIFLGAAAGRFSGFTVPGSALGVLWIVVLQTGLTQVNAPTWTANFVQGIVLATAVLIAGRGALKRS